MNLNLRNAILSNVSGNNTDQLEATIKEAINSGEEKMLPGLGVLFELIWENADQSEKQEMLEALEQGVQQASTES
ncbi:small acid-soluble spore protein SspI [Pontibacillus yanchengensis]|uniref:Small acid-soluble spore protein SspI n=2 Tax=Pontibacillus yanchengensis TaxID=462910 RepID=A0ACC7VGC6_9BACI|nr:small acid-soluble spore protein SspI [Pontibacillus yanchengensis]MYL34173.1 small acid-soluble spore protein SspI [Pontibacillus yanchengensis]MYL53266.1 small acid-soluble spore protein SspI [Pontibacillus yanchengensis]